MLEHEWTPLHPHLRWRYLADLVRAWVGRFEDLNRLSIEALFLRWRQLQRKAP